jgi:hypothetical protein
MRSLTDIYFEWEMRFRWYWIYRKKIILKNPGIIQWEDKSFIHRPGWQDKFTIEEMEEFGKELKT